MKMSYYFILYICIINYYRTNSYARYQHFIGNLQAAELHRESKKTLLCPHKIKTYPCKIKNPK